MRRFYENLYGVLLPMLFLVSIFLSSFTGLRFLQAYQSRQKDYGSQELLRPSDQILRVIKPTNDARDKIIVFRGEQYALLGFYESEIPEKRAVLARKLSTNQVGAFKAGQNIFSGPYIEKVNAKSVLLSTGMPSNQRILVSLNR